MTQTTPPAAGPTGRPKSGGRIKSGSKTSVVEIIEDHQDTLVDATTGRFLSDFIVQIGLPVILAVIVGAVTWATKWRLDSVGGLISGVSILTGLLFGMTAFVFQLRMGAKGEIDSVKQRLDELFSNIMYAVLVGVAATVVSVLADAIRAPETSIAWGWLIPLTALASHLVLVLFMCMKRVRLAYIALVA